MVQFYNISDSVQRLILFKVLQASKAKTSDLNVMLMDELLENTKAEK